MQKDIDHPNVVKLRDYTENGVWKNKEGNVKYENLVYLVSENCSRGELFDLVLAAQGVQENDARFFFKQLIDGLAFMKSKGIFHRDLKMENLFVDSNFNLKIGDFGFATDRDVTQTYRGTKQYMAPEIHMGQEYKPEKVDVFATGSVLFTMVACNFPFQKEASPVDP